jgi:hypothetical protein
MYEYVPLTDPRVALPCSQVKLAESAEGVEVVKMAWQAPVGGYNTDFAVVTLKPKMSASLALKGDKQCLDYYTRHLNVGSADLWRPWAATCLFDGRSGTATQDYFAVVPLTLVAGM